MIGQLALLLHERPSNLMGFRGSEIQKLLLDAMLISKAISEVAKEWPKQARSTKELVRRKRASWRPPRRVMAWA